MDSTQPSGCIPIRRFFPELHPYSLITPHNVYPFPSPNPFPMPPLPIHYRIPNQYLIWPRIFGHSESTRVDWSMLWIDNYSIAHDFHCFSSFSRHNLIVYSCIQSGIFYCVISNILVSCHLVMSMFSYFVFFIVLNKTIFSINLTSG